MASPPKDRNWGSLLKWSLAQSDNGNVAGVGQSENDPNPNEAGRPPLRQLSEEDRKFLIQAMQNGMVDEIKRMKDITSALSVTPDCVLPTQEDIDARVELIHELNDRVCSIDNGGDLHTIGGLVPIVKTLSSPHAQLRAAAAEVISTTVQNHEKAQLAALECACVAPLLQLVLGVGGNAPPLEREGKVEEEHEANDAAVATELCRVKALLALSSLTRGCPLAVSTFISEGGMRALRDVIENDSVSSVGADTVRSESETALLQMAKKTKTKTMHLARHLCVMSDEVMCCVVDADLLLSVSTCIEQGIPSFGKLAGDWSDATRVEEKKMMPTGAILSSQLREAGVRFLLCVAQCVDFEKTPKALDDLRSEMCVGAINTLGRWYLTFDGDEKETHKDEMTVCAELGKMFG